MSLHIHIPTTSPELCEIPRAKFRSAPAKQRRGFIVSQAYDGGPEIQMDFVQCCHCERVWPWVQGSDRVIGWCARCEAYFCGPECETCVPAELMIENMSAGMPFDEAKRHRPITARAYPVSAGGVILGSR